MYVYVAVALYHVVILSLYIVHEACEENSMWNELCISWGAYVHVKTGGYGLDDDWLFTTVAPFALIYLYNAYTEVERIMDRMLLYIYN